MAGYGDACLSSLATQGSSSRRIIVQLGHKAEDPISETINSKKELAE
jgi:hypothetical protein